MRTERAARYLVPFSLLASCRRAPLNNITTAVSRDGRVAALIQRSHTEHYEGAHASCGSTRYTADTVLEVGGKSWAIESADYGSEFAANVAAHRKWLVKWADDGKAVLLSVDKQCALPQTGLPKLVSVELGSNWLLVWTGDDPPFYLFDVMLPEAETHVTGEQMAKRLLREATKGTAPESGMSQPFVGGPKVDRYGRHAYDDDPWGFLAAHFAPGDEELVRDGVPLVAGKIRRKQVTITVDGFPKLCALGRAHGADDSDVQTVCAAGSQGQSR